MDFNGSFLAHARDLAGAKPIILVVNKVPFSVFPLVVKIDLFVANVSYYVHVVNQG